MSVSPVPTKAPVKRPPSLAWTLARSQLLRRRTQNISAVLGIAVGIAVLITALSLTNGFTGALVEATLRATPHLSLNRYATGGLDPALEDNLKRTPQVQAFTPFLADKGLLTRPASGGQSAGIDFATLFGVGQHAGNALQLPPQQQERLNALQSGQIVLGAALAQSLGAYEGQTVRLLNSTQRRTSLKVAGLFRTGNYVIDSAYAFVPLGDLQKLQGHNHITGYQIRLHDPETAPQVGQLLTQNSPYSALPWQNLYGSLLAQMKLQKQVIGFVVFLIVVVAAFGIANVLTLSVFEKAQDIAILRAIGASRRDILQGFVWQGAALGLAGILLGNILGLAISTYFIWRPFQIPGDLYFITSLPVQLKGSDFIWVNVMGLITTLLAAYLPARRAASIEPARIIR